MLISTDCANQTVARHVPINCAKTSCVSYHQSTSVKHDKNPSVFLSVQSVYSPDAETCQHNQENCPTTCYLDPSSCAGGEVNNNQHQHK